MNRPDDVPTSLTRRAYALRGVTLSQNQYAAVVADAYEDIKCEVLREAAEKIRAKAHDLYGAPDVAGPEWRETEFYGLADAADLIDPDKEN